ncbi:MAG: divalent-cation tolerance protein CutA [Desulfocapsa sp.]|nr:MAG: divalent-cation tolerance protein CutA [Desulfocapsa sp.]
MFIFVYITAKDFDEARKIARHLLEKKLIACANIFPVRSMFWWEGKIEECVEFVVIVKTKAEKFKELREEVKKIHSYSVPCICSFVVEEGLREFLDWIDKTVE